jgi:polysaccharide biosynthesis transport protein
MFELMFARFTELVMSAGNFDSKTAEGADEVDLDGIAAAIRRNKRLIAGVTIGAAAAALLFCLVVKPRYMAESRVLVENQESYFNRADPDGSRMSDTPVVLDAEEINSQIQLLTSRDLGRRAIKALGLRGNPEFDPGAGGLLSRGLALLGIGSGGSDEVHEDRLLTNFLDHLTVMSPAKTRVLQIEFSSRDPDLAAKGANTVADLYIELKSQAKRDNAHRAAENLRPSIASLEARVAEAEAKVEQFRAQTGFYENSLNASVPTQQLGEIAAKLAEARAAQSEAQAKAHGLRDLLRQGRLGDAAEISSNDLVRRVSDQRVLVRAQLASESRTLLPAHPRIKELEAQLADLDNQLRTAVDKAARGLENDARVSGARVANLTALLDEQKKAVGVSNADETQLRELQRTSKALKDQLASEAAKYQAALARDNADSAPADARIISRALSPSVPVFPKKTPIVVFATLAGLFFSVFGIAAREMTAQRRSGALPPPPLPRDLGRDFGQDFGMAAAPEKNSVVAAAPVGAATEEQAVKPEVQPLLQRLKQAVASYAAPAVPLEHPEPEAKAAASEAPSISAGVEPQSLAEAEPQSLAEAEPKAPQDAHRDALEASRGLIERIRHAATQGGAKIIIASAGESAPACAGLKVARTLAWEGRAILVQVDDEDVFLRDALTQADENRSQGAPQPGLAQLLSGEASFAEAIYRDVASRLHIVQSGGSIDLEDPDLSMILDALHATYDFVLIAGGEKMAAASLAAEVDLAVIFAEDARKRDFLHDDFAAAGARAIVLAGVDSFGEIVEMAA